ncbi:MAG: hypothetical protein FJW77_13340 [Actinobacteria bacterium]|nr:hypothetical protein [Actinomycetota bacterium]
MRRNRISRWWLPAVGVVVAGSTLGAVGGFGAGTAGAARPPDACTLLKASEIAKEFDGAVVGAPTPGTRTAASVECNWSVAAGPTAPAGTVSARLMFTGGKAAYRGLQRMPGIEPVAGRTRTLAMPTTGALMTLQGSDLITVQGVFLSGVPVRPVPVPDRLLPLLTVATARG